MAHYNRDQPPASPRTRRKVSGQTNTASSTRENAVPEQTTAPANGNTTSVNSGTVENGSREAKDDLRELEVLFAMWRSAGKTVNLWDWLEGFRATMEGERESQGGILEAPSCETGVVGTEVKSSGTSAKRKRSARDTEEDGRDDDEARAFQGGRSREGEVGEDGETARSVKEIADGLRDEKEAARLHAVFVRFCEEARMMGLVRARGKTVGRRGDEVVKGVGLI
jgi:hypothetical protein